MSRFNVDKVVAPTRCPRAFASLSKFLKRPPVYLLLLVSPFLLSYVARIRDSSYRAVTVRGESGIAEVRVLALSARNYVRELWNFMYGVSVSKYANSIRPFLRWEIVPSSCKLSPRSNGLGFSFSFSPLLDPLHASILCALRGKAPRFLLPLLLHLPAFRERNFVIEKLHRMFSLLTRDHRLPFSTLWHTNTTSIENFDGVVPPSPFPRNASNVDQHLQSPARFFPEKRRKEGEKKERKKGKRANSLRIRQFLRSFAATVRHRSATYGHPLLRCREFILSEIAEIFDRLEREECVSIARRMEFLVSDNYNEGEFFPGIVSKRFALFLCKKISHSHETNDSRERI